MFEKKLNVLHTKYIPFPFTIFFILIQEDKSSISNVPNKNAIIFKTETDNVQKKNHNLLLENLNSYNSLIKRIFITDV